ncbi:taste receptor type 1 member 1 isoform X2 [Equus przewalskii]|uniref:Taste receptor type 1 member 1 isoform X2 n=1 Tax=Equus przewalskii TaxID=9798 RepID=A0ABM4N4R2_EQUPR
MFMEQGWVKECAFLQFVPHLPKALLTELCVCYRAHVEVMVVDDLRGSFLPPKPGVLGGQRFSAGLGSHYRSNSFNSHGYHLFQAMRFSIEEINNSTALLPNVTLGYELYDVCSESASVYAMLRILSVPGTHHIEIQGDTSRYSPTAVAVIGPSSTNHATAAASMLSPFLVPLISYKPSSETLGVKRQYPSFLHTIPSDKYQVEIMVLLLQSFGWVWISLVGSDDEYGQLGVQALENQGTQQGICIAFKGIVPSSARPGDDSMWNMMSRLDWARTTVVVVFSSRQPARVFFESVVLANLTAKVWIASEDWAISTHLSSVPGIWGIGTVLGVAIQQRTVPGLKEFEEAYVRADKGIQGPCPRGSWCSSNQLCRECQAFTAQEMPTFGAFAMSNSYNVYRAVYAVAHGLHQLLGCTSGACSRGQVYPGQLLEQIHKVNFLLHEDVVTFNDNRDPLSSYDIIAWDWSGPKWTFQVIGSSRWSPVRLDINKTKIQWHGKDNQVPTSVCSSNCLEGHAQVIVGVHHCCFECVPCEAGTFLNKSVWTPLPTREYQRFPQLVMLDCTEAKSLGFVLAFIYNSLLSVSTFACSYLGKDLPENYNEAKCVTFSLLLNFVSWIAFFTTASVYQGKYLPAVTMLAALSCLSGGFSGYFLPKCYVILCRPDLNSTAYFQASIQEYTRRCSST